jgi:hypothetical protein
VRSTLALALVSVLACTAGAAAHKLTTADRNETGSKFDIESFVTTHTKKSFRFKITLYDEVTDADFTNADVTKPEEERGPQIFEDVEGNRVCAYIERRVSDTAFPKYLAACTEKVTDGKLTAKLYRVDFGLEGRGKKVRASRNGKEITLVVRRAKLPRAKTTRVSSYTRYVDPALCANACWDDTASRPQRDHSG